MHRKQKQVASYLARVLSLVMAVLVLNLCIQVPTSQRIVYKSDAVGKFKIEKKTNKKFILAAMVDYVLDTESNTTDDASSNLLEELNEAKEDWCYHTQAAIQFQDFHSKKQHGEFKQSLFTFIEDARLSPPPEQV